MDFQDRLSPQKLNPASLRPPTYLTTRLEKTCRAASSTLRCCRNILGNGAGEALQRDTIDEAAGRHGGVDRYRENESAMRLYLRPGFLLKEDKGVHNLMRRTPGHAGAAPHGRGNER